MREMECPDGIRHHTFTLTNYSNKVLLELNKLRQNDLFCDVRIYTDEGYVTAHKTVMCAVSPHFKERLSATSNQIDDIYLEDTNHYLVMCLIDFIYTGTLVVKSSQIDSMEKLLNRIKLNHAEKLFENLKHGDRDEANQHDRIVCENMNGKMLSDEKMLIKRSRKRKPSRLTWNMKVGNCNGNDMGLSEKKPKRTCDNSPNTKTDIIPKLIISFGKKDGTMVREKLEEDLHNDGAELVKKKPCFLTYKTDQRNETCHKPVGYTSENKTKQNKLIKDKIKPKDQARISDKDGQEEQNKLDPQENVSLWTLEHVDSFPNNKQSVVLSDCNLCKTCDLNFSCHEEYLLHVQTHVQDKTDSKTKQKYWQCTVCSKNLTSHIRHACHQYSKHGIPYDRKLKLHACTSEGCKYITASKHYLQIHMQGRHGNNRPHVCEYCGKGFKLPSALITHLNIHTNKKRFDCEECGMSFHQKGGLDIHMKKHHEGQQSWSELCHLCSEKFLQKADLCWHLYISHGLPVPDRYKVFACELCDYKTIRKNKLTRHMDSHQNNRSFVCNVCGKKFVTKSYLNRHMKYHGEKTHICDYDGCTYSCVDQIGLKKHVRLMHTHKNYKPFSCTMCTYKTGLRGNLDKHIRTVHNLEVVTKHTVHMKMKFKDRQSGDIITKDGHLVQAAGQKMVADTEKNFQHEKQINGTDEKDVNPNDINNVRKVKERSLDLPTNNTGQTTLEGQSDRSCGQLYQQPLADVLSQAFNLSNQVQFPMATSRSLSSTNQPTANQSDLFLTIDPLTSFKYFISD